MSLKHADIWRAIDRLAEQNGLSPSGLARKCGLSPTAFNPSKRIYGKRKRWPSTESVAHILYATDTSFEEFVRLTSSQATIPSTVLPLLTFSRAGSPGSFNDLGHPTGNGWEATRFPLLTDAHAFAIEIDVTAMEPIYHEGDRLVVSPLEKPRRGDRVVVRRTSGEITIMRLEHDSPQKIDLSPLTSQAETVAVLPQDIAWMFRIICVSQ